MDRKARLAAKRQREEVVRLRKYAANITSDGNRREFALTGARLATLGAEPGRDGWPRGELLEQFEDALDGVELEDDGAAEEAADLLRQCADHMEAAAPLQESPPRP